MSSSKNAKLFFEIVQIMGLRGYNILPFNFLIDIEMQNQYHQERGEEDKIVKITDPMLYQWIAKYRFDNYGIQTELFQGERMQFSMVFDHSYNGMRTLVCIGNEVDESTAKSETKEMIEKLKTITLLKTEGRSCNPHDFSNKVSGIFVLSSGVSPFAKSFFDEMTLIELIKDDDILHRSYDNCFQSFVYQIPQTDKNRILSEVGLSSSSIPSTSVSQDVYCKILGIKPETMLKYVRERISSEETTNSVFLRNVRP
uniref:Uncharacterized protein n=1 Tax=viral metagenome TaxID=1070528 RepID=A0A6C0BEZ7_9ZZZZ